MQGDGGAKTEDDMSDVDKTLRVIIKAMKEATPKPW